MIKAINRQKKTTQAGAILMEMLLGVSLFIVVIPMLIYAIQKRNNKLEERGIAKEVVIIRDSIDSYIKYNKNKLPMNGDLVGPDGIGQFGGGKLIGLLPSSANASGLDKESLTNYGLPTGMKKLFIDGNVLGQTYGFVYYKSIDPITGVSSVTPYVYANGGSVSLLRLNRIANLIGFQAAVVAPQVKCKQGNVMDPIANGVSTTIVNYVSPKYITAPAGALFNIRCDVAQQITNANSNKRPTLFISLVSELEFKNFLYKDRISDAYKILNTMSVPINFNTGAGEIKKVYQAYSNDNLNITGTNQSTMQQLFVNTLTATNAGSTTDPYKTVSLLTPLKQIWKPQDATLNNIVSKDISVNNNIDVGKLYSDVSINIAGDLTLLSPSIPALGGFFTGTIYFSDTALSSSDTQNLVDISAETTSKIGTGSDKDISIKALEYNLGGSGDGILIKSLGQNKLLMNGAINSNILSVGDTGVGKGLIIEDTSQYQTFSGQGSNNASNKVFARISPASENTVSSLHVALPSSGNLFTFLNKIIAGTNSTSYAVSLTSDNLVKYETLLEWNYKYLQAIQMAHQCFKKEIYPGDFTDSRYCPFIDSTGAIVSITAPIMTALDSFRTASTPSEKMDTLISLAKTGFFEKLN